MWLKSEHDYDKFWDYTFSDIEYILRSYKDVQKTKNRQRYDLAVMIAAFTGKMLAGKQIPDFEDVYQVEEEEENTEYIKANMLAWMMAVNKQRKAEREECQKN